MRTEELIKREAASFYNLTRSQMEGPGRAKHLARPRQLAMTLCRFYARSSFAQIGGRFGQRDHTTVIHAMRQVEQRCSAVEYAEQVGRICARIELEMGWRRIAMLNRIPPPPRVVGLLPPPPAKIPPCPARHIMVPA
jgi:hypothetical protein